EWYLGLEEQDTSDAPEWASKLDFSTGALTAKPELPIEPEAPPADEAAAPPVAMDDLFDGLEMDDEDFALSVAEPPAAPVSEMPDWFAELDGGSAEEAPLPETPRDADDLFGDMGDFAAPEAEIPAAPAAEVPDWFAGLGEESPAEPVASDEDDLFAFDFEVEAPGEVAEPAAPQPGPAMETPDWFADLGAAAAAPEPAASDEADDLFGDFSLDDLDVELPEEPPAEPVASDEDDLFAFDFAAETPGEVAEPTAPQPGPAMETPDWFADLSAAAAAPEPAPADEADDLFGDFSLDDLDVDLPEETPAEPVASDEDDLFAFDFEAEEPAVPVEPAAPQPGPVMEAPDWFADLSTAAADPEPAEEADDLFGDFSLDDLEMPEAAPGEPQPDLSADLPEAGVPEAGVPEAELPQADLPDWFDDIGVTEEPAAPTEVPPLTLDTEDAETPDWFADFEASGQAAAAPSETTSASDMPDWLADLSPADAGQSGAPPRRGEPAPARSSGTGDLDLSADFDFMDIIEAQLGDEDILGVDDDSALTTEDTKFDLDALLSEDHLPEEETEAAEDLSDLDVSALPDWLARARPTAEAPGYTAIWRALRNRQEAPLENLNTRLQALRKRTTEATTAAPPPAAPGSGALAGIDDGLAPTRLFTEADELTAAPQLTAALALDATQERRIAMLDSVLGLDVVRARQAEIGYTATGEPIKVTGDEQAARIKQEARRARARARRKPDRLLLSLLLLIALIAPFFIDISSLVNLPTAALDPAQHGTIDRAIQALQPGDLVLVGFEYGPTVAGEVDTLARALLTHILLRGGRPVVVSTNPAGVLHAQDVLAILAEDDFVLAQLGRPANDPLTTPEDYVVLPYLPGGAVGLRSLLTGAGTDRGIYAVDLTGDPTGLTVQFGPAADPDATFAFMLVLAERGEDVRAWVEQVGAASDVPLAAGVTAGAEPVARPYFDSGQLFGLLAGYRDAYIYDRVLLASLLPVRVLPTLTASDPASLTPADGTPLDGEDNTDAAGVAVVQQPTDTATPTPTLDEDAELTPSVTPTAMPTVADRLITLTPSQTPTPGPSDTPQDTPTNTEVPTETPTLTETVAGEAGEDTPPTATPQPTATATPTLTEEEADEVAALATDVPFVEAERPYRDERWQSMSLGAIMASVLIGLGALVNIVRAMGRRRNR
ncbi:MAG: hypothetical protein JW910_15865, partial [Anaerolineae bacterium]|nr:hypothetical protein [Anaerolineae bacterium]